jgi:hypothetical protein
MTLEKCPQSATAGDCWGSDQVVKSRWKSPQRPTIGGKKFTGADSKPLQLLEMMRRSEGRLAVTQRKRRFKEF